MTIEQAIDKAVEGGWITDGSCALKGTWIASYEQNRAMLDPLFWHALGYAMGWYEYDRTVEYKDPYGGETMVHLQVEWKYQWHRMIDHLIDDGSIESFFEKL